MAYIENFDILDEICQKRVFPVDNGKSEHHGCILHIPITLAPYFTFLSQFWIFGPNSPKKGIFGQKREKVNMIIEFYIFDLVLGTKFHFKQRILNFGVKICPKKVFLVKSKNVNIMIEFYIFQLV